MTETKRICVIPTLVGRSPKRGFKNPQEATAWADAHQNPKLKRCGTLPGCENCLVTTESEREQRKVEVRADGLGERVNARRSRVRMLT